VHLNDIYISKVIIFRNIHQLFIEFACLSHRGKVNLKSLPFPTSLSIQIFPLYFITNSLKSNNPKPVPVSFAVPFVVITSDILNSFAEFSKIADVASFDQKLARGFRKNVSILCAIRDTLSEKDIIQHFHLWKANRTSFMNLIKIKLILTDAVGLLS
jgi:hypothetical protein